MKQLALALGLLAVTVATSSSARADDYAIVQFADGYCRIWWESAGTPWGVGWTKIATGLPDHPAALAALDTAIAQRVCQ
jgi:ABC-type sugar transport system substrate-binding protein